MSDATTEAGRGPARGGSRCGGGATREVKRLALVLAVMFGAACAGENAAGERFYDNNDAQLAVGNAAFMTCTCIFVMEMPDMFCSAWVKASPAVARVGIDRDSKSVESSAFVTWAARAKWVDAQRGCVLE